MNADLASPFGLDRTRPKLTLVVDEATCEPGEWLDLLFAFGEHELLDMLATAGDPPALRLDRYRGGDEPVGIQIERGPGGTTSGANKLPGHHQRAAAKAAATSPITADRALGELLLAQAAKQHSHFLVTDSRFLLLDAPRGLVRDANPIAVRQALAIVGLYLRTENEFLVEPRPPEWLRLSSRLFYRCLAWDLLPTAWRWFNACGETARHTGHETLLDLADSALDRIGRALRARDHLLARVQRPPTTDVQDEALFFVDAAHMFLSGAFDSAALIAHLVYGIEGPRHEVGWKRKRWREQLQRAVPDLAERTATATNARDVLDLMSLVRNTIHREALRGAAYSTSSSTVEENLIVVPDSVKTKLLELVDRLGGDAAWGVRNLAGDICFEADTYLTSLVCRAAATLDGLLAAVEMKRLPGVNVEELAARSSARRTAGSGLQAFSPAVGQRLRLLAGLPPSNT